MVQVQQFYHGTANCLYVLQHCGIRVKAKRHKVLWRNSHGKKTGSGMEVLLISQILIVVQNTNSEKMLLKNFNFVWKVLKLKFLIFTNENKSLCEIQISKLEFSEKFQVPGKKESVMKDLYLPIFVIYLFSASSTWFFSSVLFFLLLKT